jgi:hypothetical protein
VLRELPAPSTLQPPVRTRVQETRKFSDEHRESTTSRVAVRALIDKENCANFMGKEAKRSEVL